MGIRTTKCIVACFFVSLAICSTDFSVEHRLAGCSGHVLDNEGRLWELEPSNSQKQTFIQKFIYFLCPQRIESPGCDWDIRFKQIVHYGRGALLLDTDHNLWSINELGLRKFRLKSSMQRQQNGHISSHSHEIHPQINELFITESWWLYCIDTEGNVWFSSDVFFRLKDAQTLILEQLGLKAQIKSMTLSGFDFYLGAHGRVYVANSWISDNPYSEIEHIENIVKIISIDHYMTLLLAKNTMYLVKQNLSNYTYSVEEIDSCSINEFDPCCISNSLTFYYAHKLRSRTLILYDNMVYYLHYEGSSLSFTPCPIQSSAHRNTPLFVAFSKASGENNLLLLDSLGDLWRAKEEKGTIVINRGAQFKLPDECQLLRPHMGKKALTKEPSPGNS